MKVKIGALAACSLGLDAGAAEEMGLKVLKTTKTTTTLEMTIPRAFELIAELSERGDAQGEGWDLEAGERAACRRAAKAVQKAMTEATPI